MNALRAGVVLSAVSLAACDNLLGLHDIISDGEPVALLLTSESRGVAQQPMGVITVDVVDVLGTTADFSGEVTLAFGNNPVGATLLGTLTATATRGRAEFDLVAIDKPGTAYTLIASTEGLPPVTSSPIDVVAPRFVPVPTGLAGGPIASVVVSPAQAGSTSVVFASARDGVYRSVDRGASWKLASFGAHTEGRLVADPSRPGVIYSTQSVSLLKKTTDGGATWHNLSLETSYSVVIDPKNPSVVYAMGSGLLRSTDGGTSWSTVNSQSCDRIAVDPVADTLYCAAYDRFGKALGVYRSSNGGAAWDMMIEFAPPSKLGTMLATPTGVFVVANGQLHRSINAGGSWTMVSPVDVRVMAYAPSMPNRIYLSSAYGVSVSNDGGASFGTPVPPGDSFMALAVDPTNPDVVYAGGTYLGVWVSTNGGVSWSPSSKGIDAHPISSVAMAPGTPGTLLTTTAQEALRTTNGGASWTTVSQHDVTVRFDPVASTRVYLCGLSFFAMSTNSGASFTGGDVTGLDVFCSHLLVAGTTFFAVGSGGLRKSIDSGASWASTGLGSNSYVEDAVLGDAGGNVVVAATLDGIYRSTNGGASFMRVVDGYAGTLAADPKVPTRIVAGQCEVSRLSTDAGASFRQVAVGKCVTRVFAAGSALYAVSSASDGTFLLTSTDGGSSWEPVEITGIPGTTGVDSIAVSDDGQTVYLGTQAGLYKSVAR